MYAPTNLDPKRKYPIINYIYPGPQGGSVGSRSFSASRGDNQALAELGQDREDGLLTVHRVVDVPRLAGLALDLDDAVALDGRGRRLALDELRDERLMGSTENPPAVAVLSLTHAFWPIELVGRFDSLRFRVTSLNLVDQLPPPPPRRFGHGRRWARDRCCSTPTNWCHPAKRRC